MKSDEIIESNKTYWNDHADLWFGTTALPEYGVRFPTEDKSYHDESYFKMPVHDSEIVLCNRKMSTYINALAKAGFVIEQLVEETDEKSLNATGDIDPKTKKAKMMPISFCLKARKL